MSAQTRLAVPRKNGYESISYDAVGQCNVKSRWRIDDVHLRECLAEFFGTFVLVAIGTGVNNQVALSNHSYGSYLSINIGWGIACLFGVHCADGISGADLNPAVTLARVVYRGLPWWKLPGYAIAQTLGAFVASWVVYFMHRHSLYAADPARTTMYKNFVTAPYPGIDAANAFYTEVVATSILLIGIFAITDKRNRPVNPSQAPVRIMLLLTVIGMAFGMNTGYAMNPARDFGPRVFTSLAGWGTMVFTTDNYYFWIPLVAPWFGAVIGGGAYKLCIENHYPPTAKEKESILDLP